MRCLQKLPDALHWRWRLKVWLQYALYPICGNPRYTILYCFCNLKQQQYILKQSSVQPFHYRQWNYDLMLSESLLYSDIYYQFKEWYCLFHLHQRTNIGVLVTVKWWYMTIRIHFKFYGNKPLGILKKIPFSIH